MNTLLTPIEIFNLAFSDEENYNISSVKESDIAVAESRYLLPIIGEELYACLLDGDYADLLREYIAPMLGAWTRYIIEPMLAERCGLSHGTKTVDAVVLARLRVMAMVQSHRLSDYLNANTDEYSEYNPIDNPLNHCSIDGNIVQIY